VCAPASFEASFSAPCLPRCLHPTLSLLCSCARCDTKRWKPGDSKYCKHFFICENCLKPAAAAGRPCPASSIANQPEPEPALSPTPSPAPALTQMALGGRVLWIDPKYRTGQPHTSADEAPHMRWCVRCAAV